MDSIWISLLLQMSWLEWTLTMMARKNRKSWNVIAEKKTETNAETPHNQRRKILSQQVQGSNFETDGGNSNTSFLEGRNSKLKYLSSSQRLTSMIKFCVVRSLSHLDPDTRKMLVRACLGERVHNVLVHNLLAMEIKILFLKLTMWNSTPHKSWTGIERTISNVDDVERRVVPQDLCWQASNT